MPEPAMASYRPGPAGNRADPATPWAEQDGAFWVMMKTDTCPAKPGKMIDGHNNEPPFMARLKGTAGRIPRKILSPSPPNYSILCAYPFGLASGIRSKSGSFPGSPTEYQHR